MVLGLPDEVLAATKANFEPHLPNAGRKQVVRVCQLCRGTGNDNARQDIAPQPGLARTQGAAAPATVTAQLAGARRHGTAERAGRRAPQKLDGAPRASGHCCLDLGTKIDLLPRKPALIVRLAAEVPISGGAGIDRLV